MAIVRKGFSLLELSVVLAVIGLVTSMSIMVGGQQVKVQEVQNTWNELQYIKKALNRYAQKHSRLPCPSPLNATPTNSDFGYEASTCSGATSGIERIQHPASGGTYALTGMVPFKTLRLNEALASDDWGNRYHYAVSEGLLTLMYEDDNGLITVQDISGNTITDSAAYVVMSHGETGKGATSHSSQTVQTPCDSSNPDGENCDFNDGTYRDGALKESEIAANFYDDWVVWQTRSGSLDRAANSGPNGCIATDVRWQNTAGVLVSNGTLTKNVGGAWNTAGGVSERRFAADEDGYVEITAAGTSGYRMFGFSDPATTPIHPDPNANHHNTIDYAIYARNGGSLYIYESGASRGTFGTYSAGDVLRVQRQNGTIYYKRNGVLLYTSTIASTTELMVDSALHTNGTTLTDTQIYGPTVCKIGESFDPTIDCDETKVGLRQADGSICGGITGGSEGGILLIAGCDAGMTWDKGSSSCTGTRTLLPWISGSNTDTDVPNYYTIDGEGNTETLADHTTPHPAADFCDSSVAHSRADWYLPSMGELANAVSNGTLIGGICTNGGSCAGTTGSANNTYYWSSSEINSSTSYLYSFQSNNISTGTKTTGNSVRCIRRISNVATPAAAACDGTQAYGTVCPDGTIYVGPTRGGSMMATRCDAGQHWNGSACEGKRAAISFGSGSSATFRDTDLANYSTGDGVVNTSTLVAEDAHADAVASPHPAAQYCHDLVAYGYSDWYLPSVGELSQVIALGAANGICENNAAPATCHDNDAQSYSRHYWSSTEYEPNRAYYYSFTSGYPAVFNKQYLSSIRCVRKDAASTTPAGASCDNTENYGATCADGTIYVGPTRSGALMTTPCDAGMYWNGSACTGKRALSTFASGTIGSYLDTAVARYYTSDGQDNTAKLIVDDASSNAGTQEHPAANYCDELVAYGYNDWYLPSIIELSNVIGLGASKGICEDNASTATCQGKYNSIGTEEFYWSSSDYDNLNAYMYSFALNRAAYTAKYLLNSTRCVRKNTSVSTTPSGDECDGTESSGTACDDGTLFAGVTQDDGNYVIQATRCDAGMAWDGSACAGQRASFTWATGNSGTYLETTVANENTSWDGDGKTTLLAGEDASSETDTQEHPAAIYCNDLIAHGYDDWYLPSAPEMTEVANMGAPGNLCTTYNNTTNCLGRGNDLEPTRDEYWTSSEATSAHGYLYQFSTTSSVLTPKYVTGSVRCVRQGPEMPVTGCTTGTDIEWTNEVSAAVSGTTLTKTAGGNGWNSGASSTQSLDAGEDGFVEMTMSAPLIQMFGLSETDSTGNYTDINYAIYPHSNGTLNVYESGASRGNFGTYTTGDVLRVEREGTTITYKKNDSVVYTSTVPSTTSLIADSSLHTMASVITDGKFYSADTNDCSGYVTVNQEVHTGSAPTDWEDIDLSSYTGEFNTLAVLLVEDTGGTFPHIFFRPKGIDDTFMQTNNYQAGTINATLANGYSTIVIVPTSEAGIIQWKANISGSTYAITLMGYVQSAQDIGAGAATVCDVEWTDLVGATDAGGVLTKTAGAGWGNAGAASTQSLDAGEDGYVEMTMTATNQNTFIGFSETNADANYNTIDYGLHPNPAAIQIYENGTHRGAFGSYAIGDVVRVERTGTTITYKKNGAILYTSTIPSSTSLVVDSSIYGTGNVINDAKIYPVENCSSSSGGSGSSQPGNCQDVYDAGSTTSGTYTIYPDGSALETYCDMTTAGGPWTLIANSTTTSGSYPATFDSSYNSNFDLSTRFSGLNSSTMMVKINGAASGKFASTYSPGSTVSGSEYGWDGAGGKLLYNNSTSTGAWSAQPIWHVQGYTMPYSTAVSSGGIGNPQYGGGWCNGSAGFTMLMNRVDSPSSGARIGTNAFQSGCNSAIRYSRNNFSWQVFAKEADGGGMGSYQTITPNTTYTASSDGFVVANARQTAGSSHCYLSAYVEGNQMIYEGNRETAYPTSTSGSITFAVKSGEDYEVQPNSYCNNITANFIPYSGGSGFGSYQNISVNTVYTASTDSFVIAQARQTSGSSHCSLQAYVDGNLMIWEASRETAYPTSTSNTIAFPVKSGSTYEARANASYCQGFNGHVMPLNSNALGDYQTIAKNTAHTATSDGFVLANAAQSSGGSHCYVMGYLNGTQITYDGNRETIGPTSTRGAITFPVKQGDSYEARLNDPSCRTDNEKFYFVPLASGGGSLPSGLILNLDASNSSSYSGSGSTWTDISGENNSGTISGATFSSDHFSFDGSNDYINLNAHRSDFALQTFTASLRVRIDGTTGTTSTMFNVDGSDSQAYGRGYWFNYGPGATGVSITHGSGDGSWEGTGTSTSGGTLNSWHNITMRVQGGGTIDFYTDGNKVHTGSVSPAAISYTNLISAWVGGKYDGANPPDYWKGDVQKVHFYNRALSDSEISSAYGSSGSGGGSCSLTVSGGNNQKMTLANTAATVINDTRDSFATYKNLPSYLIGTQGTDKVNGSNATFTLTEGDATCYMIRQNGWSPVDMTGWTLKENNMPYMHRLGATMNVSVYEKTLAAGTYNFDVLSAFYVCDMSSCSSSSNNYTSSLTAGEGWNAVESEVKNGSCTTSWADIDLSGDNGTEGKTLSALLVEDLGGSFPYQVFRPKGQAGDFLQTNNYDHGSITATVENNKSTIVILPTDTAGAVQHQCNTTGSTYKVTNLGYVDSGTYNHIGQQVYTGNSPNNTWTDIDLSSHVGTNGAALVTLLVEDTGGNYPWIFFRTKGVADDFMQLSAYDTGSITATMENGKSTIVILPTDENGVIEWNANSSGSTYNITLLGYIPPTTATNTCTNVAADIEWTDVVGVTVSGNDLTKPGANSWNAGAASTQIIPAGEDGYIEMTIQETDKPRMFGLSAVNADASYTSITYAAYATWGGPRYYVYENGVNLGQKSTYTTGDVFRVERVGTTIYYKKNGTTVYTSTIPSTTALIADVSLYAPGTTIKDAKIYPVEVCTSGGVQHQNCQEILDAGDSTGDGTYTIYPDGSTAVTAYCDMTTDGGGWTAIINPNDYAISYIGQFGDTSDIAASYSTASNYAYWGGNSTAWGTPRTIDVGIPYAEIKINWSGNYHNSGLGYLNIADSASTNPQFFQSTDAHAANGNGQSIYINGATIMSPSQVNISNRTDTFSVGNQTILHMRAARYNGYTYNPRYIHALWVRGNSSNSTTTQEDFCAGSSTPGSGWVSYSSNGAYLDVNTSSCGFSGTPKYITSLGGNTSHWTIRGESQIYTPTATGFRVYIQTVTGPQANSWGLHVNWIGVGASSSSTPAHCVGSSPAGSGWVAYSGSNSYTDISTSSCSFSGTPKYITSLGGNGNHAAWDGESSIYSPTANSLRIYLEGSSQSNSTSQQHSVHWLGIGANSGTSPESCGGATTPGSGWQAYGSGIYIDIDTSSCNFSGTPKYMSSMGGTSGHWGFNGESAIYSPTATGFRIYIVAATTSNASSYGYHINWIGFGDIGGGACTSSNCQDSCSGTTLTQRSCVNDTCTVTGTETNSTTCGYVSCSTYGKACPHNSTQSGQSCTLDEARMFLGQPYCDITCTSGGMLVPATNGICTNPCASGYTCTFNP